MEKVTKTNVQGVHDGVQDVLDWLKQVKMLDELIDAKVAERGQLLDLATKMTQNMDGMPHAPGVSDKVGNVAVKLADLADETNKLVDTYVDHKNSVVAALMHLPAMEFGVLHRYFIRYMTMADIALDMGYSVMQVWRYKQSGLKHLKDVIECYTIPVV